MSVATAAGGMKQVMKIIAAKAARLAQNELFSGWLENDAVAPKDKFVFTPMALDFIMGFRDFNRYYVRYPSARNALEAALDAHAAEDETHSALLLEDWAALGMDERLGWAPRDLYWWLTSAVTEEARRADFELISLVHHHRDPLLRFAIVESMEAAGKVFFTRTAPVAEALEAEQGIVLPYHGRYHLDRETGHLQNADERLFFSAPLSEAQRERAPALVTRVFEIFELHFTAWERFARAVHEKRWNYHPARDPLSHAALRPDRPADVSAYLSLDHPPDLTGPARDLAQARNEAFAALWRAPFHAWVREAWPGDFRRMTRYFLLQWVVDNWTCADYFTFDTPYPEPRAPLERGINRLSSLYRSEMSRRYVEWTSLGLDEYTGWSAGEALRHYWLDERVEEHRAVFAELRKLTFQYPEPLYRYWIMKCFVRFGDALMGSLGEAMRRAGEADEGFIAFAGHPERMHPDLPPDPEADAAIADVERQPLCPADVEVLRDILARTSAQEAERAAISWRVIQEKRYERFDRRWSERRSGEHFPRFRASIDVQEADEIDADRAARKERSSCD